LLVYPNKQEVGKKRLLAILHEKVHPEKKKERKDRRIASASRFAQQNSLLQYTVLLSFLLGAAACTCRLIKRVEVTTMRCHNVNAGA